VSVFLAPGKPNVRKWKEKQDTKDSLTALKSKLEIELQKHAAEPWGVLAKKKAFNGLINALSDSNIETVETEQAI
jgi:hypothetical protein